MQKNTVKIRNLILGEGIIKVCIPLVAKTDKEIIETAKGLKEKKFDLVEWRLDHYENVFQIDKVKNILDKLRIELGELPLLVTFRSKNEGGEKEISKEDYIRLNKELILTNKVDLIDVELFTGDEVVKEIVNFAHKNEVKVIMSNHDFYKTPDKKEIVKRLCRMQELGADLPKIAVMPNTVEDVLTLLCATNEMVTKYADRPIITMSMSGLGVISRIAGEVFGSALTFGAAGSVSAPGQVEIDELNNILELLHKSR